MTTSESHDVDGAETVRDATIGLQHTSIRLKNNELGVLVRPPGQTNNESVTETGEYISAQTDAVVDVRR